MTILGKMLDLNDILAHVVTFENYLSIYLAPCEWAAFSVMSYANAFNDFC